VNTIADRIRDLRKAAGMTQAEFATKACVSRDKVTRWETGRKAPGVEALVMVARVLGTSMDWLVNGATADVTGAGITEREFGETGTPYLESKAKSERFEVRLWCAVFRNYPPSPGLDVALVGKHQRSVADQMQDLADALAWLHSPVGAAWRADFDSTVERVKAATK
jgi:transcriptional regulator with XRE-family HTH domain